MRAVTRRDRIRAEANADYVASLRKPEPPPAGWDYNFGLRAQLVEWDADYNRNAGAPRPDDRKDTTTDD